VQPRRLTTPQKSSAFFSVSGKRKERLPTAPKPLPLWNAAGRRKAHISYAINWSGWARPGIIGQFTVYSYDSKAGKYSFTTLADPDAKPTTGGITINGNLWTYDDSSFTANGKATLVRVTNEFTDSKTEVFKVTSSEDNGANWKIVLQGVAHKVAD
jgi:hypothetical protein